MAHEKKIRTEKQNTKRIMKSKHFRTIEQMHGRKEDNDGDDDDGGEKRR